MFFDHKNGYLQAKIDHFEPKNEYEPEKLPKPAPGQRGDPYPKTAPNN